jgi:hypothetical protein
LTILFAVVTPAYFFDFLFLQYYFLFWNPFLFFLPPMAPKRKIVDGPSCREVEFVEVISKRSGTSIKSRAVGIVKSPRRPKRFKLADGSRLPPAPKFFPPSAGPSQGVHGDVGDLPLADDDPHYMDEPQDIDHDLSHHQKTKKRSGKVGYVTGNHLL